MKTIAIDFEGTIYNGAGEWIPNRLPGTPNPGAFEFVRALLKADYAVVIHSERARGSVIALTKDWFVRHGLEAKFVQALLITDRKPEALLYVDDRGFRFTGSWPSIVELETLAAAPGKPFATLPSPPMSEQVTSPGGAAEDGTGEAKRKRGGSRS